MTLQTHLFAEEESRATGFEAYVHPYGRRPRPDFSNCEKHFFVPRRVESATQLSSLAAKVTALPDTVAGIDDQVWQRIRAILAHPLHVYETRAGRLVVALRRYAFCQIWGRAELLVGRHIPDELHFALSMDEIAFSFRRVEWAGVLANAVIAEEGSAELRPDTPPSVPISVACRAALGVLRRAGVLRELRRCVRHAVGIDREVLRLAVLGRSPWHKALVPDSAYELAYRHRHTLPRIERETPGLLPLVFYGAEAGIIRVDDGAVGAVKRALRARGISNRVWRILAKSKTNPFRVGVSGREFERNWDAAVDYCQWLDTSGLDLPVPQDMHRAIASREEPASKLPPLLWLMACSPWPVVRTGLAEYWRRQSDERERFIAEEFLQVMDWAWSASPELDANQQRAGWQWLLKKARLWAETVRIMKRCSALSWQCPVQTVETRDLTAVALATPLGLWKEAQALRHCAASYDEKCATGDWLVYSIRDAEGKRLASAAFKRNRKKADRWALDAVREFANADAIGKYRRIAGRIVRALNRCKATQATVGKTAAERMGAWLKQMERKPVQPRKECDAALRGILDEEE